MARWPGAVRLARACPLNQARTSRRRVSAAGWRFPTSGSVPGQEPMPPLSAAVAMRRPCAVLPVWAHTSAQRIGASCSSSAGCVDAAVGLEFMRHHATHVATERAQRRRDPRADGDLADRGESLETHLIIFPINGARVQADSRWCPRTRTWTTPCAARCRGTCLGPEQGRDDGRPVPCWRRGVSRSCRGRWSGVRGNGPSVAERSCDWGRIGRRRGDIRLATAGAVARRSQEGGLHGCSGRHSHTKRAGRYPDLSIVPGQGLSVTDQDNSSGYAVLIFLIRLASPGGMPGFWCQHPAGQPQSGDHARERRDGIGDAAV
jgi:hypothetical protein